MNEKNFKKIGRNELCPCGSGKKYKKCCLINAIGKNEKIEKVNGNLLSELNYRVTDEPLNDPEVSKLPKETIDKIDGIYDRMNVVPHACITELKNLIEKYPHISKLYNYLYGCYMYTGQSLKAYNVMRDNYNKNPNYLFAKLNYAEYLMNNNKLYEMKNVFKEGFNLDLLYPEREVFHMAEVISFHGVIGHYYVLMGKFDKAEYCLNLLREIAPNDGYTMKLQEELNAVKKFMA